MGQLLPHPELQPSLPETLTMPQRMQAWFELMKFGEEMVLAGIKRDLKPGEDLWEAYRAWYDDRMSDHDKAMEHMLRELSRRETNDGH